MKDLAKKFAMRGLVLAFKAYRAQTSDDIRRWMASLVTRTAKGLSRTARVYYYLVLVFGTGLVTAGFVLFPIGILSLGLLAVCPVNLNTTLLVAGCCLSGLGLVFIYIPMRVLWYVTREESMRKVIDADALEKTIRK